MKRLFATAAVCAALTGLLTGCSGTNYSYDGSRYDTRDVYRDGMAYDGYYAGKDSNHYSTAGDYENGGTTDTRRGNRTTRDGSARDNAKTTSPRANTSTTAK